ncbi:nitroreductase family protein [Acetonema longum]|uniref:Nitroreductase n=1 Tax=Acetonema longum DSM 6540 TaxID=1009370 RepID=F7NGY2_9FIRM|nr:nitroreductase family protein [Acetonema longum]EGO64713.1 nitroreductase [Acetonema longum DSM 6540]
MEYLDAIRGRRSCRNFKNQPIEKDKIHIMLEAAIYAPSPANRQPWEFIVANNPIYNMRLKETSEKTKEKLAERSGWKWLPTFNIDFLLQVPTLIVVVGDPSRNGAEQFLDVPSPGYVEACSASIQNMLLAAHAQGLGTLWFTLFEKADARKIFSISEDKDPISIICVGYPVHTGNAPARKGIEEKVKFID